VGPRCGGGNLGHFSSGRPRRGQAAAPLAFSGDQVRRLLCRCKALTPGPGTDGNHSCGNGDCGAGDEDTPALFHWGLVVDDAAFHSPGHRDDLAGDMA
jgi:hypothetical protein